MKNEYDWDDEKLSEIVANFCYQPRKSKRENALAWVIERLILTDDLDSYNVNSMKLYIFNKLKKEAKEDVDV